MTGDDRDAGPVMFAVGKPTSFFDRMPGVLASEGFRLHLDRAGGLCVWALYRNPTAREVRGARSARIRVALIRWTPHTSFWLLNADPLTDGWADMPFAIGTLPAHARAAPPRAAGQGYLVTMALIDPGDRVVHALRSVTVSPAFSDALDGLLSEQAANVGGFTQTGHDRDIQSAWRRWPEPVDMLGAATIIETAGVDETFGRR